jgi:putative phosphoribosyl transferase
VVSADPSGSAVVLALPRGGVPVAETVAEALGAPLDVIGVRKVGAPGQPELGVGAVAEGGAAGHGLVLDEDHLARLGLRPADVASTVAAERAEVDRRIAAYREGRSLPDLRGRTVVVVDDGIATGVTAHAACRAVRALGAARVVLAVPVAAPGALDRFGADVDDLVVLAQPAAFGAVGRWYADFGQTTDDEVHAALARASLRHRAGGPDRPGDGWPHPPAHGGWT